METGVPAPASQRLVARDGERVRIEGFLATPASGAVLLTGPAGAGKTTLWEHGCQVAAETGTVLTARPHEAERHRPYAVLRDLLGSVLTDCPQVPSAPARAALQAALLLAPAEAAPEPAAIDLGVRELLAHLTASGSVVVAIDDLQWADAGSRRALTHAVRRKLPLTFVLTSRQVPVAGADPLLDELRRRCWVPIALAGLDVEETRLLLATALGLRLPLWAARRLTELSHGNPLHSLELGRHLRQHGLPDVGEPLTLPDAPDLLAARVRSLSPAARTALLAAALEPRLREPELVALVGIDAVDEATRAQMLRFHGDRVRPSHPLLGKAALEVCAPAIQRRTHRALGQVLRSSGSPLAVRHELRTGPTRPDAGFADELAAAAREAATSGDTELAVELCEAALAHTPGEPTAAATDVRAARVLALASALADLGATTRLERLLDAELPALPAGDTRAAAHLLRLDCNVAHADRMLAIVDRALAEPLVSAPLRAQALSLRASVLAVVKADRIDEATRLATRAYELDPAQELGLAWCRALQGTPYPAGPAETAVRHAWRGEPARADAVLRRAAAEAAGAGQFLRMHDLQRLSVEVALRAGDVTEAAARLERWTSAAELDGVESPEPTALAARVAALRGDWSEAATAAEASRADGEAIGKGWAVLDAGVTLGLIGLLNAPREATAELTAVNRHCAAAGVREPGAFPVALDLVALHLIDGHLAEATQVAADLERASVELDHPWARAVTHGQRGLLDLALGARPAANCLARVTEAVDELALRGTRHDAARLLLTTARLLRRRRRWADARAVFLAAADRFTELGATGWAAAAAQPARDAPMTTSGRQPALGLTRREQEVAQLLLDHLTDAEIAETLMISRKTAGHHVSAILAKLGVSHRREAARRLRSGTGAAAPDSSTDGRNPSQR